MRSRDIIADSGDYRRGCALAETKSLDKGTYTIVCSTFAPDQLGRFTLWISSTIPCVVTGDDQWACVRRGGQLLLMHMPDADPDSWNCYQALARR